MLTFLSCAALLWWTRIIPEEAYQSRRPHGHRHCRSDVRRSRSQVSLSGHIATPPLQNSHQLLTQFLASATLWELRLWGQKWCSISHFLLDELFQQLEKVRALVVATLSSFYSNQPRCIYRGTKKNCSLRWKTIWRWSACYWIWCTHNVALVRLFWSS